MISLQLSTEFMAEVKFELAASWLLPRRVFESFLVSQKVGQRLDL